MAKVSDSPQFAEDVLVTPLIASENDPVLASVEKRELELKAKILRAHQTAEEIIAKARAEAAEIRVGLDRSGREEAAGLTESDLRPGHEKAAAIAAEAAQTRLEFIDRAQKNSTRAVDLLMLAVLPKPETETESEIDHVS